MTSPLFAEKPLELILLRIFKSNHFYDQQVLISNFSDDFRFFYKSPMTKGVVWKAAINGLKVCAKI